MTTPAAVGLAEILGGDAVVRDPAEAGRWSAADGVPDAVVFPRSVEELARTLEAASERGWAVLPAGAGGWLDGGGPPSDVRIVVSTRRMDAVIEYEPADLTLTAEAGVPLAELDRRAGENGQWIPQDPPGWEEGTLGAFVSTGLPGPLVAGYGRPRDHLLGVTVVTGDGRVVRAGGRVVKNVAGYDLVRLLVGSWGTLGVIAGATVRLFPRPDRDVTHLYRGANAPELVGPARALATARIVPEALELVSPLPNGHGVAGATEDVRGAGIPPGGRTEGGASAALAVRLLGSAEAVAEKERIVREAVGREPDHRLEEEGSRRFHRALAAASSGATLALRLALEPDALGRLVDAGGEIRGRARARGFRSRIAVHVTRGVLRLDAEREVGDDGVAGDWSGYLRDLRERLEADGGSLLLVRGPARLCRSLSRGPADAGVARLLKGLKEEFDPAGILAPDRLQAGSSQ